MQASFADLAPPQPAADTAAESFSVSGFVPQPRCFSLQVLKGMQRQELGPTQVNCFTGRPIAWVESYAGVRLTALLEATGLSTQSRADLKRCVFIVTGRDRYRAIFSWNELYNSPLGQGVLVLHERNGLPLDRHLGTLCLISAHDAQLGPRHLRGALGVEVLRL